MEVSQLRPIYRVLQNVGVIGFAKQFRWIRSTVYNSPRYKGPNNLIPKLKKYLLHENGYFVELGANDGIAQSNTNFLERSLSWRGVLIEPTPTLFKRLVSNRATKNSFFNVACCSFEYKSPIMELIYGDLMTISIIQGLDVDIESHQKKAKKYLSYGDSEFKFTAPAKPLNEILAFSNSPKLIDFLSLDVEGAEYEVLLGINFKEYNFKYILVESRGIERIVTLLASHGYVLKEQFSSQDYFFEYKITTNSSLPSS